MKDLIKQILRENLLNEGKQVGILYHFTRANYAVNILEQNNMRPHAENGLLGVSMTRDKDFWDVLRSATGGPVRFKFDGNKISNNYKVIPFNAFQSSSRSQDVRHVESEELVIVKFGTNFKPIDYLIDITVNLDKIINDYIDFTANYENDFKAVLGTLNKVEELKKIMNAKNIKINWKADKIFNNELISAQLKKYVKNLIFDK